MTTSILAWILLLAYLSFIIFIFIGGGYITRIIYKSDKTQLACIDLDDTDQLNIAKLTVVLFWIVFIPLCILPLILAFGYGNIYISKILKMKIINENSK